MKHPPVVYFARTLLGGDLIKIGLTTNLLHRMMVLTAEPLLVLRGSRRLEREMQERFAEYRAIGEWFRPGEGLTRYIEARQTPVRCSVCQVSAREGTMHGNGVFHCDDCLTVRGTGEVARELGISRSRVRRKKGQARDGRAWPKRLQTS